MLLEKLDHRSMIYDDYEKREASRAIIRNGEFLFMIYVKKENSYIFPGGGIEIGESLEETCIREAKEEAGAIVKIKSYIGYIDELWDSKFGSCTYNLKSHYFECELLEEGEQLLLGYEKEYGFEPKWITAAEALKVNLEHSNPNKLRFLERNIYLLNRLVDQTL